MNISQSIGRRIKEERLSKHINQTELSKIVNTTQDTISLWEKGERTPTIENLIKLSEFFSINIEELLGVEKNNEGKYVIITNYGNITINQ